MRYVAIIVAVIAAIKCKPLHENAVSYFVNVFWWKSCANLIARTYFAHCAAKPQQLQLIHVQIYQFELDAIVLDKNPDAKTTYLPTPIRMFFCHSLFHELR